MLKITLTLTLTLTYTQPPMFDRFHRRNNSHSIVFIHNTCTVVSALVKESVKSAVSHEQCRRGAHLSSLGREPVAG